MMSFVAVELFVFVVGWVCCVVTLGLLVGCFFGCLVLLVLVWLLGFGCLGWICWCVWV